MLSSVFSNLTPPAQALATAAPIVKADASG
jgi:hypothetical protein